MLVRSRRCLGNAFRATLLTVLALSPVAGSAAAEQTLVYQGQLSAPEGQVADGDYPMSFALYASEQGGAALWFEELAAVPVQGRSFSVVLGSTEPLSLAPGTYWLEVSVAGEAMTPRSKLLLARAVGCTIDDGLEVQGGPEEQLTGLVTVAAGSTTVTGEGTLFTQELRLGDAITIAGEAHIVASISSDTQLTIDASQVAGAASVPAYRDGNLLIAYDSASHFRFAVDRSGQVYFAIAAAGAIDVCRTPGGALGSCSSSARHKTDVVSSHLGLGLIERLRPVEFEWKDSGSRDLGLIAEEVAALEPRLVTTTAQGEVEGVKYRQLTAVLVNAIREQQAQISEQRTQVSLQQSQIAQLMARLAALESAAAK